MSVVIRRLSLPPAGTLLAALRPTSGYTDCFEIALPLAQDVGLQLAGAPVDSPTPILCSTAMSTDFNASPAHKLPVEPSFFKELSGDDALTAYLRSFYTSAAFSPERAVLTMSGMATPPLIVIASASFSPGYRLGPFAMSHRGSVSYVRPAPDPEPTTKTEQPPASASFYVGSEATLGWGPVSGVAGASYHALLVRHGMSQQKKARYAQSASSSELVFLFGSALWRTNASGESAWAGATGQPWLFSADAARAAFSSVTGLDASNGLEDPFALRPRGNLPLAWSAMSIPHRVYSRVLLASAVDRHLRLSGLL